MNPKSNDSKPIDLNRVIEDSLADILEVNKVRRIIPVAFPVMEVEHTVKIRREETLGLIERYVLESIARFGPIRIEEIAGLLGLDKLDIELVLSQLERFQSTIIREGEALSTPKNTLEKLREGIFVSEIDKKDAYFVNGLSGILLPREELNTYPKRMRLNVEISGEQSGVMSSYEPKNTGIFWILPSGSDGITDLVRLVASTDINSRTLVGIPEGSVSVENPSGDTLHTHWILSIGILLKDGSFTIRPVSRKGILLLEVTKNNLKTSAEMLRSGSIDGSNALAVSGNSNDIPRYWSAVSEYKATDGKILLSLNDADSFSFFQNEDESFPASLREALGGKYFWNSRTYFVSQIQPGDNKTAQVILKLQGIDFLSQLARSDQREVVDFPIQWNVKQQQITKNWPKNVMESRVEFSEIKSLALRSTYSVLVEFVSEMP